MESQVQEKAGVSYVEMDSSHNDTDLTAVSEQPQIKSRRASAISWSAASSFMYRILSNKGVQCAPVGLMFGITYGVYQPIFNEMTKDRVCRVIVGMSEEYCHRVGDMLINGTDTDATADRVRKLASDYVIYASIVANLPCIVFSLFVGDWSDKFGRKLPLIGQFAGMILCGIAAVIIAHLPDAHPGYLMIPAFVQSVCGGWVVYYITINSYIGDHTVEQARPLVLMLVAGAAALGSTLGTVIGTTMIKDFGFPAPFYLFTGLHLIMIVFCVIMIQDLATFEGAASAKEKLTAFFDLESVRRNFAVLRQPRLGRVRLQIALMVVAYLVATVCLDSESTIMQYLVEFKPISWSVQGYGAFAGAQGFVTFGALGAGLPIAKGKFNMKDSLLGIISCVSCVCYFFIYGITYDRVWMLYMAVLVGIFRPMVLICVRSILIALVDPGEVGKVMAIVGTTQAVSAILHGLIFLNIFSATASIWPGTVYFVMMGFMLFPLASLIYIFIAQRRESVDKMSSA